MHKIIVVHKAVSNLRLFLPSSSTINEVRCASSFIRDRTKRNPEIKCFGPFL